MGSTAWTQWVIEEGDGEEGRDGRKKGGREGGRRETVRKGGRGRDYGGKGVGREFCCNLGG